MKDKSNTNRSAGVPRPYASKTLPSPSNVLKKIVSPFKIWEALVFISVFSVLVLAFLVTYGGFNFSSTLASIGGIGVAAAVGIGFRLRENATSSQVPSIEDVSNISRYYRAASRLSIYTIAGSFFSMAVLLVAHIIYPNGAVSRATTLLVVGILVTSLICSYMVVLTLCSYSSKVKSSFVTRFVKVSSIPEIVAVIGIVLIPVAVFIAGELWQSRPLVIITFEFTVIDGLTVMVVSTLMYISAISRF